MLEEFQDEIPGFAGLQPKIRAWIEDSKLDLETIRMRIYEHILAAQGLLDAEGMEIGDADTRRVGDAISTAWNALECLLDDLPVTRESIERIDDYLGQIELCYDAYRILLTRLRPLLTAEEVEHYLAQAKKTIAQEFTRDWEPSNL
jgi:hypothetical protein